MAFMDEVFLFVTKIATEIVKIVDKVTAWLDTPQGLKVTEITVEVVSIIVKIMDMINPEPLTGGEKRELARGVTRFVQAAPPEALQRLAELKRSQEIDRLTYAELDALLGNVIAAHVSEKHERRRSGKTK